MKRIGVISTAVLFVLLGTAALGYRQQDQQDEKQNKPEQQGRPEKQKPEQQQKEQQQDQNLCQGKAQD